MIKGLRISRKNVNFVVELKGMRCTYTSQIVLIFLFNVENLKKYGITQKWKLAGKDSMDDVSSDGIKGVYVRFRPCTHLREQMKRATFFDVSKMVFGKKWAEPAATPNP